VAARGLRRKPPTLCARPPGWPRDDGEYRDGWLNTPCLAGVLETRGADPQQGDMRRVFLADIPFPAQARVLEIGCGTGVLTRMLARRVKVAAVVAVDQGASLLGTARQLAADLANVSFHEADGGPCRSLSRASTSWSSTRCCLTYLDPKRHSPKPFECYARWVALCQLPTLALLAGSVNVLLCGHGPMREGRGAELRGSSSASG
jgi:SAM-dependent methyltransferase